MVEHTHHEHKGALKNHFGGGQLETERGAQGAGNPSRAPGCRTEGTTAGGKATEPVAAGAAPADAPVLTEADGPAYREAILRRYATEQGAGAEQGAGEGAGEAAGEGPGEGVCEGAAAAQQIAAAAAETVAAQVAAEKEAARKKAVAKRAAAPFAALVVSSQLKRSQEEKTEQKSGAAKAYAQVSK